MGGDESMDLGVVYLEHCLADPDFYDSLQGWDDSATRFALADAQPHAGWGKYQEQLWVSCAPNGVLPPAQGWKVHVSATPANAEQVLSVVAEHCLRNKLIFKFLRSRQALQLANSKYADRAASDLVGEKRRDGGPLGQPEHRAAVIRHQAAGGIGQREHRFAGII